MIRLSYVPPSTDSLASLRAALQNAIVLEFSTLPPYLYAYYTVQFGTNEAARARMHDIVLEEMIHFCLACNILNAIGGSPIIACHTVARAYPRPLPYDIGTAPGEPAWQAQLLPFGPDAIAQGMHIEEPEHPDTFPDHGEPTTDPPPDGMTIGQFYESLKQRLAKLPADAWHADRNQIHDDQYFAGELFAVNNYDDAARAIDHIVSQGEGSAHQPLDFEGDVAHYYRFAEIHRDQVLESADNPEGFAWGAPLGVDWAGALPAIANPSHHDFSQESAAVRAAQAACDDAFRAMMDGLQGAMNGKDGQLGVAVRGMFKLRQAALVALQTPLQNGQVAGPTFVYTPAGGEDHESA